MSCLKVHIYEGKATITGRSTDLILKDSALIRGMVYSAMDKKTPEVDANVWMEGTNLKTTTNNTGYFNLKLLPGAYTIKCLGKYSSQNMMEELKNVIILPNEVIEIEFLQGIIVE